MTEQIEKKALYSEEVSNIFFEQDYNVENVASYKSQVSVAWKIYEGNSYHVLELVIYLPTTVEKVKNDKRTVSELFYTSVNQMVNNPNSPSGIRLRKVFGVKVPHYGGKQVIIVADKFLVSRSQDERDTKVDSVEIVPLSELSSVLKSRKNSVIKRAGRIFKPNKAEDLQKAYSRARTGLILTIILMFLLVLSIFLNITGEVFQILLTVDSILIIATIITSFVIHELGVAKFKKMLREEIAPFQEPAKHFVTTQKIPRTSEAFQEFPEDSIEPGSSSQHVSSERFLKKLEIEKHIEPPLTERTNSSEFYAQRRERLWDLAQKSYAEGEWKTCTYHLKGAVSSALKEIYVKLTGKVSFGTPLQVAELVCDKTELSHERVQQFFDRIKNGQKLTESDLSILFKHAQALLTDLQSAVISTSTFEADSVKKDVAVKEQKEPKQDVKISKDGASQRTALKSSQNSSKTTKKKGESGKYKTVKKESDNEKSERLHGDPEGQQSRLAVETEAEITDCDSVVETIGTDKNISDELKKLLDSRSGKVDSPVFLVVTQSLEVVNIVESLKRKYPDISIGTYERAVNGKAQIIVSHDGGISSKINYESHEQLENLIRNHAFEKILSQLKPSKDSDDFTEFLEE
ncbi:MAG: hypothetical protein ACUVXA_00185 [Candidatus Jordarchaeum sp.]|uniref:hypothetical protein n=1 Tax=Candidatus Jordarchaeum sp. TaxID=2823881 RepID=UPI004049FE08